MTAPAELDSQRHQSPSVRLRAALGAKDPRSGLEQRYHASALGLYPCHPQGRYDRIHVGASCPLEHLPRLTALLGPQGGSIVTPVAPSDLRLITVSAAGVTTQRVLSQVRYGELEVRRRYTCLFLALLALALRNDMPNCSAVVCLTDASLPVQCTHFTATNQI